MFTKWYSPAPAHGFATASGRKAAQRSGTDAIGQVGTRQVRKSSGREKILIGEERGLSGEASVYLRMAVRVAVLKRRQTAGRVAA